MSRGPRHAHLCPFPSRGRAIARAGIIELSPPPPRKRGPRSKSSSLALDPRFRAAPRTHTHLCPSPLEGRAIAYAQRGSPRRHGGHGEEVCSAREARHSSLLRDLRASVVNPSAVALRHAHTSGKRCAFCYLFRCPRESGDPEEAPRSLHLRALDARFRGQGDCWGARCCKMCACRSAFAGAAVMVPSSRDLL